MELKKIYSDAHETEGTRYEEACYKIGEHYEALHEVTTFKSGKKLERFRIKSNGSSWSNYLPDIEFWDGTWGDEPGSFKIQTPAYGALSMEETQKLIEGYQEALEVARILTEAFC